MSPGGPPQLETEPPIATQAPSHHPAAAVRPHIGTLPSLPEAHRTIPFNAATPWFRKALAFAGPGYLVAVGYMDPGNWATDIGGGGKFGFTLLTVLLLRNLMTLLLQEPFAQLGIATRPRPPPYLRRQ